MAAAGTNWGCAEDRLSADATAAAVSRIVYADARSTPTEDRRGRQENSEVDQCRDGIDAAARARGGDLICVGYCEAEDNALSEEYAIVLDAVFWRLGVARCALGKQHNSCPTATLSVFHKHTQAQTIIVPQLVCLHNKGRTWARPLLQHQNATPKMRLPLELAGTSLGLDDWLRGAGAPLAIAAHPSG